MFRPSLELCFFLSGKSSLGNWATRQLPAGPVFQGIQEAPLPSSPYNPQSYMQSPGFLFPAPLPTHSSQHPRLAVLGEMNAK